MLSFGHQQQQQAFHYSRVPGIGATAACAGVGAECSATAAAGGRRQGCWQAVSDDDKGLLPDLCESSSDDERDRGEVGFDELFSSSEPVQSLRGALSAKGASSVDCVYENYQGVQGEAAGCSATGDAEWS